MRFEVDRRICPVGRSPRKVYIHRLEPHEKEFELKRSGTMVNVGVQVTGKPAEIVLGPDQLTALSEAYDRERAKGSP